jgi:hypothetical protein|mmetsp:Transcript_12874/g.23382  ORF Transcript_12874/g.23382 Transcript_12874/m.23382 type:complete len:223 (-) Transcript_12874:1179-1847(-)
MSRRRGCSGTDAPAFHDSGSLTAGCPDQKSHGCLAGVLAMCHSVVSAPVAKGLGTNQLCPVRLLTSDLADARGRFGSDVRPRATAVLAMLWRRCRCSASSLHGKRRTKGSSRPVLCERGHDGASLLPCPCPVQQLAPRYVGVSSLLMRGAEGITFPAVFRTQSVGVCPAHLATRPLWTASVGRVWVCWWGKVHMAHTRQSDSPAGLAPVGTCGFGSDLLFTL